MRPSRCFGSRGKRLHPHLIPIVKRLVPARLATMSTINATIDIGEDSVDAIVALLSRFPKGHRVRVALTDEPSTPMPVPSLDEFTARVEAARLKLRHVPWITTDEAMRDLREGKLA